MTGLWLRRAVLLAASASAVLLAACGSSTIESALTPSRFIGFGDGFSDVGQTAGGTRHTVNDGSINLWAEQIASRYGLSLTAAKSGGQSYAQLNARVLNATDAAGGSAPSIKAQIDAFLATGTFGANDVVLMNGGIADVIAEGQAAITGAQSGAQALLNVQQAGRDLGAQARRLVQAGAKYVVVSGSYNLGVSRWAAETGQSSLLGSLASGFNEALLVSMVDLGANVLYVDAAYYINLVTASPTVYLGGSGTASAVVCTSTDAGAGIGTGAGQINSAQCTSATVAGDPAVFVFADRVYLTPNTNRLFGNYAYDRLRARW